ncbi:hypothetical protein ACFL59_11270 [Planctomycetota bacterium]
MHVRTSTVRRHGKTYRYAQLVESYRRDDGMPAHRVVASLGSLPKQAVDNLRLALRASRDGRALVLAADTPELAEAAKVQANLRYLDLAVLLALWREWRLDELLAELLPDTEAAAPAADVIAALVLQRCVAPGSKLYAQRWLPTSALPELLGLQPERFNNTRVHRVLDELYAATPQLQQRLPDRYQQERASTAFFMDVTDTYFEGRGCGLAQRHRTKAGHRNKWSIGLVLLANERGYPLRWKVIASKTTDHQAMGQMVEEVQGLEWVRGVPCVFDRAMGKESSVRHLSASGLLFLTAAPVNTIESHTDVVPYRAFAGLELDGSNADGAYAKDIRLVAQAAREAGLEEVHEHLFVLDLGVVERKDDDAEDAGLTARGRAMKRKRRTQAGPVAEKLRLARQLRRRLDAGEFETRTQLARALGLTPARVAQILNLLRLAPDIQEHLLNAPPEVRVPDRRLRAVVHKDHATQRERLRDVLDEVSRAAAAATSDGLTSGPVEDDRSDISAPKRLRMTVYFNPQMLVDQRRRAQAHLVELNRFVAELNDELLRAKRSRTERATRRKIERQLERYDYYDAFDVLLDPIKVTTSVGAQIDSFRCRLELRAEPWARRQRYHGFVLLLGHPALPQSGRELARLYHAKDVVEKDFQTIKSVVKLRPVFHRTDPKVQAHVTVCMLALLLQRILEQRLREADLTLTAPACLEILATCHLNRMKQRPGGRSLYSVTQTNAAQHEALQALGLTHLVDDEAVAGALTP